MSAHGEGQKPSLYPFTNNCSAFIPCALNVLHFNHIISFVHIIRTYRVEIAPNKLKSSSATWVIPNSKNNLRFHDNIGRKKLLSAIMTVKQQI